MAKNKVVMVVLNPFVNDARVLREAISLTKDGYELTLLAMYRDDLKKSELKSGFSIIRIPLISKKWSKHPLIQIIKYIEFVSRCLMKIFRIRPHYLHCHDLNALPIGVMAKILILRKTILIYDSHELWSDSRHDHVYSPRLYSFGIFLERILIRFVDSVIVPSKAIGDIIQKKYKVKSPILLMNIPSKNINRKVKTSLIDINLPADSKKIIFVGGMSYGRGIPNLLQALTKLDNNVFLLILGFDFLEKGISPLIEKYDLRNRVILLEPVLPEEVIHSLSMADVGVIPFQNICDNNFYSMPNKIFEYLLAGLPVAVSNFPEMSRLVLENKIGVVFNPEDPDDIALSIKRIFDDPELFDKLKKNVKMFSENNHWDVEAVKLLKLYSSLA
ncbi:glycosyltransferase [Candidatus Marinimicrobia bacterium MT.SAG.4]|nr:glycosyltransferase [Candidatus Marinimicrobia bacterium MT.SAG.4]